MNCLMKQLFLLLDFMAGLLWKMIHSEGITQKNLKPSLNRGPRAAKAGADVERDGLERSLLVLGSAFVSFFLFIGIVNFSKWWN